MDLFTYDRAGTVLIIFPDGRELPPLRGRITAVFGETVTVTVGGTYLAFGFDGLCLTGGFSLLSEFIPDPPA